MFQICSLTARGSSGWSHPFCFLTQAPVKLEMASVSANSCAVNVQMASETGTADLRCENQFIPTEKYDSKRSYKKADGYFPGIATIENHPVYIENRNGNSNVKYKQDETLKLIENTT